MISTQPGARACPSPPHPQGKGDTYTWLGLSLQPVPGACAGGRDREGCRKRGGETEAGGGVSWRAPWRSCSSTEGTHPSEKTGTYAGTRALLGYSALQPSGGTHRRGCCDLPSNPEPPFSVSEGWTPPGLVPGSAEALPDAVVVIAQGLLKEFQCLRQQQRSLHRRGQAGAGAVVQDLQGTGMEQHPPGWGE